MIDRITTRAGAREIFLTSGARYRKYQADDLREVLERPYRIIYRIRPDEIAVVTVMHYRQLLPEDLA